MPTLRWIERRRRARRCMRRYRMPSGACGRERFWTRLATGAFDQRVREVAVEEIESQLAGMFDDA